MTLRRTDLAAAAALLATCSGAFAADPASVYRCTEPGGRVLYTDFPCRNAVVVELHPGDADPNAARRRADAQAVLDTGMERLRAEQARDAEQRRAIADAQALAWAGQPPEPVVAPAVEYWPVYGGYYGPVRPRPHPPTVKPRERAHSGGRPNGPPGAGPPPKGKAPVSPRRPAPQPR